MARLPASWEPFDWEAFLEGCQSCVIYCHGGCPDGLGAARLTCLALEALGQKRSEIVELEHTDRAEKRAELIVPEAAVFYVDISPYREDLPLLRKARRVLVVDHHASVRDRMDELLQDMPSMVDLSETDGDHCAASLVGREMGHLLRDSGISDMEKKIALLRKKDVWHYQIPSEWAQEATAFCAYMQMAPVATLEMIDEFMSDLPACLGKGIQAMQVLQNNATKLFERVRVVAEADYPVDLLVLGVEMHQELAYDTRHFDKLCRRHANALVLRAILYKSPTTVDIRLSRTSEHVGELGSLSRLLHEKDALMYVGGGGHPFAAGLQVSHDVYDLARVARDLLHAAGAVPANIARSRWQDALDVAEVSQAGGYPTSRRVSSRNRPFIAHVPPIVHQAVIAPLNMPEGTRMPSRSSSCPVPAGLRGQAVHQGSNEEDEEDEEEEFSTGAQALTVRSCGCEQDAKPGGVVRFRVCRRTQPAKPKSPPAVRSPRRRKTTMR